MSTVVVSEAVPLRTDAQGVMRVGGTRVTIDTVVTAFRLGATPEEIVHQYPSLPLADVYAVIAYYLRHRTEVDSYVRQRELQAEIIREQDEAELDPRGIRERLLARRPVQT